MPIPNLKRLFQLAARRRRPASEVDAEIEAHFALVESDLIRAGWSPEAARAEAIRRFGDLGAARARMIAIEETRQHRLSWRDTLIDWTNDLRLAIRHAVRQPGLTVAIWVTLGVGVGAATTAYSVLRSVLIKPLPYTDPGNLVRLWEHNRPRNQTENLIAPANYLRWKERSKSYADLAIYTWSNLTLVGDGAPQTIRGRSIEPNLFSLLGAAPALGRTFTPDDPATAVILGDALWRTRFGADPGVLGRRVAVAGGTVEIVGVMPPSFRPLGDESYWEPFQLTPDLREPRGRYTMVVGRLRPGVSVAAAQAEADRIGTELEGELPAFDKGWGIRVIGLHDQVVGEARPVLLIIGAAVGLVLLIAIANVANLLIAQAVTRLGEVSLRTALGGSSARLARTWTIEALVQVGGATATGLALGLGLLRLLRSAPPELLPRANELAVDGTVVIAAIMLALVVGIGYGTIPLWTLGPALGTVSGRRTTEGGRPGRLRDLLVVGQVAVSIVLLVGAGLLLRSLALLAGIDPGVKIDQVAHFEVSIPSDRYPSPERQLAFFEQFDRRLAEAPGVRAVGSSTFTPLAGFIAGTGYSIPGTPVGAGAEQPSADIQTADSGYFATLGIPLIEGRLFSSVDRPGSPRVVLVSRQFARVNWPNGEAVGRQLLVEWGDDPTQPYQIVGVVGDVTYHALENQPGEAIYFPLSQDTRGFRRYFVRGTGSPVSLATAVKSVMADLDHEVPINEFGPLTERWEAQLASRRQPLVLLTSMAVIAVGLALVGIYGVLSYAVRQRGREIGIRSALGASRAAIAWSILRRGLGFATLGAVIGAFLAGGLARLLGSLLYGTSPTDPITFGLVVLAMVGFAGLASALPARQATRIDPANALRSE